MRAGQEAAELLGPFQTAKVKLAADLRKQGKRLAPQDLSSGPMFPQGHGSFNPGVPRSGLQRTGAAAGPRNPAGAPGPIYEGHCL